MAVVPFGHAGIPPAQDGIPESEQTGTSQQTVPDSDPDFVTWIFAGAGIILLIVLLSLVLRKKKTPIPSPRDPLATKEPIASAATRREPPDSVEATRMEYFRDDGTDSYGKSTDELTVAELESPLHPIPPPTKLRLVEIGGIDRNLEFRLELRNRLVIGRKHGCDAIIDGDLDVSREHFLLSERDGNIYIEDLGTTNGTKVNGVAIIGEYRLENGDRIIAGRTELRIILE